MLYYSFILLNVFAHQIFLQIFDSVQETSLGTLGQGIEQLGSDLSTISDGLNKTTSTLDDNLDTSVTIVSIMGTSLTSAEISDLEREVNKINSKIKSNQAVLDTMQNCQDFATCSSCTQNFDCVWCLSLKQCVAGDSSGPEGLDCSDFEYGTCSVTGCEVYSQCGSCISDTKCFWCDNGGFCLDTQGSCEEDYLYSLQGNSNCPAAKNSESKSDVFLSNPQATRTKTEIEAEQQELYQERDDLESEISSLVKAVNEIESQEEQVTSIETPDISVKNNLVGLGDQVDRIYQQELEDEKQYQVDLAYQTQETVISEIGKIVDKDTDDILDQIDKSYNQIEQDIKDLEDYIDKGLESLNNKTADIQQQVEKEQTTVSNTTNLTDNSTAVGNSTQVSESQPSLPDNETDAQSNEDLSQIDTTVTEEPSQTTSGAQETDASLTESPDTLSSSDLATETESQSQSTPVQEESPPPVSPQAEASSPQVESATPEPVQGVQLGVSTDASIS